MNSPSERLDDTYLVMVDEEGQHSMWPSCAALPPGWTVVHGEDSRDGCLAYFNKNWRPRSMREE
ncbi:MbtH family protein [Streptomyces atratus]|uniref:MbtH family protein n=1 Tax=Streptomyces atratus TaxID=1893 RepID=A0A2Z5JHV4_STRAR|nr:MbtH family protein [Streptomyces atratus]AXE79824.1 MbtH family protein [Streptomyces atratus]QBG38781.1 Atr20 [Streptomyces atratus]